MDRLVPFLYKSYAEYVNTLRMLPLDLDGLIPAQRRILAIVNQIAKTRNVKSKKVVGAAIGSWHPHGDCYSTLVQLVRQGFVFGQGNFGSEIGIEPTKAADQRYTECRSTKFLSSLMEFIDCVKWDFVETDEKEPIFIPAVFPFCLIGNKFYSGIAVGYKTLIPCYSMNDLHNRLLYLLGKKRKKTIKPYTDCEVLSSNEELDKLLTTGKATIIFRGKIEEDRDNCIVIIKSIPYGRRFESFFKFKRDKRRDLSRFFSSGDVGSIDESSNGKTRIVLDVRRTRDKYKIFDEFVSILKDNLTSPVTFDIVLVDKDKKVSRKSVDEILLTTYQIFTKINEVKLIMDKKHIQEEIDDLEALKRIRPFMGKYFIEVELKKPDYINRAIKSLSKDSKVPEDQIAKLISKYRIRKLFTLDTDTTEHASKLKKIDELLKSLEVVVLGKYEEILRL